MLNIIEFFHIAPLFLLAAMFLRGIAKKAGSQTPYIGNLNTVMSLVLAAIGVAAGVNSHHSHDSIMYIVDPCLIYSATIMFAAVRLHRAKAAIRINVKK